MLTARSEAFVRHSKPTIAFVFGLCEARLGVECMEKQTKSTRLVPFRRKCFSVQDSTCPSISCKERAAVKQCVSIRKQYILCELVRVITAGALAATDLGVSNGCFAKVGEFWVFLCQVGVSLQLDLGLTGAFASRGSFSVACIQLIYDIHAFDDPSDGTESLIIEESIALITRVDENLSCAAVGTSRGKDNGSTGVCDLDGVVLEDLSTPLTLHGRVTVDAKLSNESRNHAKNSAFVPKARFGEFLILEMFKEMQSMVHD